MNKELEQQEAKMKLAGMIAAEIMEDFHEKVILTNVGEDHPNTFRIYVNEIKTIHAIAYESMIFFNFEDISGVVEKLVADLQRGDFIKPIEGTQSERTVKVN